MAAKSTIQVLNRTHYDRLQQARQLLHDVEAVLPKAATCGVNCDEYKRIIQSQLEEIAVFLKEWFPKGAPK